MAKINLTNQHNQENLGAFASFGVLMCMIVTLVGIKLWWFKHRLSFEQTSTQNGAAGGSTPPVIIPRRSKTPRYKKDKRYSQQIYDSGEVHGVFRQKREDDLEIERPQQLPPVRIRQLSESASSLILPPPRTKRRDKVHSTAFEDLEIVTPPLTTASSSDLADIQENDTKISLTFEEFEKQFKLKEIKPEVPIAPSKNDEVIEIPVPPLRLNRSSSAMEKPEKTTRYLKSSQSITIPEFHKVIERRPTGFSRPTEDLTKIDDYDEPKKLFETFGERRPTGYIKYEEVDSDLQEQYERELNEEAAKIAQDDLESPRELPALEALRNERIIYNNDIFESPDVQCTEKYDFNIKTYKLNELEDVEYKEEDFVQNSNDKFAEIKENSSVEFEELGTILNLNTDNVLKDPATKESEFYEDINIPEFKTIEEIKTTEIIKDPVTNEEQYITEYRSLKERRPTEFVKDLTDTEEYITEYQEFKENPKVSSHKTEYHSQKVIEPSEDFSTELYSTNDQIHKNFIQTSTNITLTNGSTEIFDEDFDNQFISWPQFEEKIEIPKVNVRRFNSQEFETQISFDETESFNVTTFKEEKTISFNTNELTTINDDKFTLNQRRPTGFVRNWPESPDLSENEEWQETSQTENKVYSQVRSVITSGNSSHIEQREVTFSSSTTQNSDTENYENSAIKQRRPTGFVRNDEYAVTFNDEDEENSLSKQTKSSKVKFEDSGFSTWAESETEKFTLNQRRPTEYVRQSINEELWNEVSLQQNSANNSLTQVKFHNSTDFKVENEDYNSYIKQRRPTGYIKKLEMLELSDEESDNQNSTIKERRPTGFNREKFDDEDEGNLQVLETKEIPLNNNVRFQEMEQNYEDFVNNNESLIKQRRPTGYVRKYEIDQLEKQVNFKLNQEEETANNSKENEAIKQRRPTGFIKKEELNKEVNFQINQNSDDDGETHYGNEQLRQRRPTGFVRKEEINKEVNFEINQNSDDDETQYGNEQLKQRRPTGFVRKEEICKEVNFEINQNSDEESQYGNEQLKQRRPTGFIRKEELTKQVNFEVNETSDNQEIHEFGNELLRQRRPTGFVKKDLTFLENPPPVYQTTHENSNTDFDNLWQEMEKDVEQDLAHNIEEEFAKIRHSYQLNEGDFLELKSPENTTQEPLSFDKSLENEWLNNKKLKSQIPNPSPLQSPQEIKITFSDNDFPATSTTTSILKEPKTEEDIQPKPRKSKVTFDFKTNERVIPARKTIESEDSDYGDDVYDKPPPPIPPQPMQRMTNINYNVESTLTPIVAIPTKISLFGSQISNDDDDDNADSWSAIRKHRNLTVELQNVSSSESKLESPPPPFYTPPPKPSYRNPMAQLAIQRAKEARADLDGFKSRSINDKKPEASKRQRQKVLNLNNDSDDGTEA